MQHGQSLHDLLVQAKPGWSQQDLQAAERKLAKVGVATCPELAAALGDLNATLQQAGLQRFSAETLGALGRTVASSPAALAAGGGGPPPPRPGPSALATVQPGPGGGSSFRAQLQAGQGRGKFGKGAAGLMTASSLERAVGGVPGVGSLPGVRLQKGGKGGFMQPGSRLGAVAGVGAEAIEAQPSVGRWEGWALVDLPRGTAVEPRPLSKEAAAKAQAEAEESEEEDEEDEEEERLSEAELLKLCKAKAIPLDRLESSKKAVQVLRLFERLEKSPASTLKNEYKTRGFAPDVGMRKEALLARVKEVVIWENLQAEHLRSVCEAQGLPVDKSLQRGQLLQLLADASWVARGVPSQRLPNLVVAHGVLDSVDGLATRSPADLAAQAKRLGVPLEARPDREDLLPRLRAAMVWKQMESPELRAECEARGAPLGGVPEAAAAARPAQPASFMLDSSKGGMQEKQALERLLLQSLWLDVWAAAGISARRLGGHAAAGELFQAVEKLRAEGMTALQESYQALDLPMRSCSDRRFILQRLSESLFWKALPLDQLREECRARGVADVHGLGGEEAGEEAERRLRTRALLSDACSRAWAARGIPVKRLETAEAAAAVAEEWGRLQGITDQDLRIQCELHGLPKEAGLEKEDLVGLLKEVAVWEALPLRELRLETAKLESAGGAEQPSTAAGGDEWAEQCRHVERLLLDRCAGAYDAKGIPARQLGSLKAAAKLAGQWAALEAMGTDGLREECLRLGMPSQNLQRQELLLLARDVALWRQLPLADLKLTCRAKGVAPPDGVTGAREEDQRELLVDALLVERCEAFYERRGIPVRRLGSVQAAARVAERWGRLESMSAGDLLLKASAYNVHAEAGLDRADLMDRLKSSMLWHELPFREIQKECRYYGVNSIARPHERRELAQRLAAFLWAPAPPPPPQPKPQPQPQPQHRQPPQGGPQQQRKSAAPPPRRPPPSQQTAATKHLRTLGLPPTATAQEIKKAYRRLALRYHPDKNLEASQEEASRRFREVADAYAALADRVKRG